jgi:hypothetical protein
MQRAPAGHLMSGRLETVPPDAAAAAAAAKLRAAPADSRPVSLSDEMKWNPVV